MNDTINTTQLTEAEMRAYESGRKAGLREAIDVCRDVEQELRSANSTHEAWAAWECKDRIQDKIK